MARSRSLGIPDRKPITVAPLLPGTDIISYAGIIEQTKRQIGADATIHAAMLVDERLDDGDLDGQATWKRVLAAVEELQSKERPPAARVH